MIQPLRLVIKFAYKGDTLEITTNVFSSTVCQTALENFILRGKLESIKLEESYSLLEKVFQ